MLDRGHYGGAGSDSRLAGEFTGYGLARGGNFSCRVLSIFCFLFSSSVLGWCLMVGLDSIPDLPRDL